MTRSPAVLLVAAAALLPGCASEEIQKKPKDPRTEPWLAEWDGLVRERVLGEDTTADLPFPDKKLHCGRHLAVYMLALRTGEALPPPSVPTAEVLIVVEGEGTLEAGPGEGHPRQLPLAPGSLGILPPGQRGAVTATSRTPLLALLLRSRRRTSRPSSRPVVVLPSDEYMTADLLEGNNYRIKNNVLGVIPGHLSLHAVCWRGKDDVHLHQYHDTFLFLIRGRASMGLGSEETKDVGPREHMMRRSYRTYPVHQKAMVFVPLQAPHGLKNLVDRCLGLVVHAPDRKDDTDRMELPALTRSLAAEGPK